MITVSLAMNCYFILRLLGSVDTDTLARAVENIVLRFVVLGEIPIIGVQIPFEAFVVSGVLLAVYLIAHRLFDDSFVQLRKQF